MQQRITLPMPKRLPILFFLLFLGVAASTQIPSPTEFLPHTHGQQFTRHHELVDYYEYVAANSDKVKLIQYGQTAEQRPLVLAFVSTPENLEKLEQIRQWNLWQAGEVAEKPDLDQEYSIIWLSFGVHGNEAGASESSLSILYELVRADNNKAQQWLEESIIVLDPSINPDGYARYTNWYRGIANKQIDPSRGVREHQEPWPGGRVNHYLFDLNRDWAWATQIETQQRLKYYLDWLPHIHVDYHEQFPDNPYYFAPAASPMHAYITDWQKELQTSIGKSNANYFNEQGWLYFTREVFDLLYPSYGDTYPTFNGSIGMTYEQAGHGVSGRAIEMENGDTLTLADRIAHHTTTAMSTIEVAVNQKSAINEAFRAYFEKSRNNPPGPYKAYIIKGTNAPGKLNALTTLLDHHRIQYKKAGTARRLNALDYHDQQTKSVNLEPGDLVISALQPKGLLVQVLFDPMVSLEDSLTYDITAWALPYAHGLEAYASREAVQGREDWKTPRPGAAATGAYAYVHPWKSLEDAAFLVQAQQQGLKARVAEMEFKIGDQIFEAGSIIYTRADNRKVPNWDQHLVNLAKGKVALVAVSTGFAEYGADLGSESMRFIQAPKVLLASGPKTDPNSFGHAWHFFENVLHLPVGVLDAERISARSLTEYNLLVLPDGWYGWKEAELEELKSWMQNGGTVIALGQAVNTFNNQSGFQLKSKDSGSSGAPSTAEELVPYQERTRQMLEQFIPGAIFKAQVDATHPIALGMKPTYFSLKTSSTAYQFLDRGANIAVLGETPMVIGFAGSKAQQSLEQSLLIGQERQGRGSIIYFVDNPLFRGFWQEGQFFMASALFFR